MNYSSWRDTVAELTEEFMAWGCRFSRKQLPEIAMTYECTPLFFWNWMDGGTEKTERGFLRVLGYAWKKYMKEEAETAPLQAGTAVRKTAGTVPAEIAGKRIAA